MTDVTARETRPWMLERLEMENVGPAAHVDVEFAPRLNLITGDNGVGKSFLLDVAWWALTRKWPRDLNERLTSGYPAKPTEIKKTARIAFRVGGKSNVSSYESTYVAREQAWSGKAGRPVNPGLVVYAHADGGFSDRPHARPAPPRRARARGSCSRRG